MNIAIEDFSQADYEDYISYAIEEYAESHIKSGQWNILLILCIIYLIDDVCSYKLLFSDKQQSPNFIFKASNS